MIYDTHYLGYPPTTPLMLVDPNRIRILCVSSAVMAHYQPKMSRAIWRPAPGRKLGFLAVQDDMLLGLIFLASPVIRLEARDEFLGIDSGLDLRRYMDMSVCVAAQPIGWHWNLGKLLAMIAPTLGDFIAARYPVDSFEGVTTTSLYGVGKNGTQYSRVYKYLGLTKGFGHEHVSETEYQRICRWFFRHGYPLPGARFEDGSNVRMRRILEYRRLSGDHSITLHHGHLRGVYFHPVVPSPERERVIWNWFERWGIPRYERTKMLQPPYRNGLDQAQAA